MERRGGRDVWALVALPPRARAGPFFRLRGDGEIVIGHGANRVVFTSLEPMTFFLYRPSRGMLHRMHGGGRVSHDAARDVGWPTGRTRMPRWRR